MVLLLTRHHPEVRVPTDQEISDLFIGGHDFLGGEINLENALLALSGVRTQWEMQYYRHKLLQIVSRFRQETGRIGSYDDRIKLLYHWLWKGKTPGEIGNFNLRDAILLHENSSSEKAISDCLGFVLLDVVCAHHIGLAEIVSMRIDNKHVVGSFYRGGKPVIFDHTVQGGFVEPDDDLVKGKRAWYYNLRKFYFAGKPLPSDDVLEKYFDETLQARSVRYLIPLLLNKRGIVKKRLGHAHFDEAKADYQMVIDMITSSRDFQHWQRMHYNEPLPELALPLNNLGVLLIDQIEAEFLERRDARLKMIIDPEARKLIVSDSEVNFFNDPRWDEAMACFTHSLRYDPTCSNTYVHRAYVYRVRGNMDAAYQELDQALELDGLNAEAHRNMAIWYRDKGERSKAEAHWDQYLRYRPCHKCVEELPLPDICPYDATRVFMGWRGAIEQKVIEYTGQLWKYRQRLRGALDWLKPKPKLGQQTKPV
jgi:tetratricopeptide (TPR) repeat protein